MFKIYISLLLTFILVQSAPTLQRRDVPPTAHIANGTITGLHLPTYNQDVFLGIPYAQPPLGSLRFVPPASYNGSLDGQQFTDYGPACIAFGAQDSMHQPQSEDCLTVNVVRPAGYEGQKLPVGLWIYGGGFQDGSSRRPAYNLSYIVENSVAIGKPFIGVSLNYRLGGLGFLAGDEVVKKGYTNLGFRDQLKAIEWVHENIAQFGGDEEHVVIWGESAGAISVSKLIVSNKLGDYVKGGIIESGSALFPNASSGGASHYNEDYATLVEHFGCQEAVDSIECLQGVDVWDLHYVFNVTNGVLGTGFRYPYIDGDMIPKTGYEIFEQGDEYSKVPVLMGTSTDEGSQFVPTNLNTTDQFLAFVAGAMPSLTNSSVAKLNELYPPNTPEVNVPFDPASYAPILPVTYPDSFGPEYPRLAALYGDIVFIGTTRITSQYMSQNAPVYKYRFNIPDYETYNLTYYGAGHFQEVVYVFDNDQAPINDTTLGATWNPDPRSREIAEKVSKLWAGFISDLTPNGAQSVIASEGGNISVPVWPNYQDGPKNMVFNLDGFHVEDDTFRSEQIGFIQSIASQLNA